MLNFENYTRPFPGLFGCSIVIDTGEATALRLRLLSVPPLHHGCCSFCSLSEFNRVGGQIGIHDLTQELRHGSAALPLEEVQAFDLIGPEMWLVHRSPLPLCDCRVSLGNDWLMSNFLTVSAALFPCRLRPVRPFPEVGWTLHATERYAFL